MLRCCFTAAPLLLLLLGGCCLAAGLALNISEQQQQHLLGRPACQAMHGQLAAYHPPARCRSLPRCLQVMTLLMDTATRAENTQMVLQVLARMARIGVTPLPQSLTTLLQCFMRLGQVDTAHRVLDWMRRK